MLKRIAKWLTIALFVGAASYAIYNQDEEVLVLLPEEVGHIFEPVAQNSNEMVELDVDIL